MAFPGVPEIKIAPAVDGDFDAAIIMECSDYARTGVTGFDRFFTINIDHHPGNTGYGAINWFDQSAAAACAEMVFDVVQALGVEMTIEIATHVYVAILTDTGSFHFSHLSPRTFDICRQLLEAGVDPVRIARQVYDSSSVGRLRLCGAIMHGMRVDATGRIAVLQLDHAMARTSAATYDDTDGIINQPLTVESEIQAVVFFKQADGDEYRIQHALQGHRRRRRDREGVRRRRPPRTPQDAPRPAPSTNCDTPSSTEGRSCDIELWHEIIPGSVGVVLHSLPFCNPAIVLMDGLLIIDKPAGPTSHDVVGMRRVLGERRIGHTGTLDPNASGVLPLVIGRATRLAKFLSGSSKTYEAVVRIGIATDTYDAEGTQVGARSTRAHAVAGRDRAGARRIPRDVHPAAAGILGQEDRRHAQRQGGARRSAHAPRSGLRHRPSPRVRARRRRRGDAAGRVFRRLLRPLARARPRHPSRRRRPSGARCGMR